MLVLVCSNQLLISSSAIALLDTLKTTYIKLALTLHQLSNPIFLSTVAKYTDLLVYIEILFATFLFRFPYHKTEIIPIRTPSATLMAILYGRLNAAFVTDAVCYNVYNHSFIIGIPTPSHFLVQCIRVYSMNVSNM